jgi:protocatechuate 3,4-dioxygenase beta subunit
MGSRIAAEISFITIILWIAGSALSQDPAKAGIQGVVKLARTGEPIVGARVSLSSAAPQTVPVRETNPTPLATATTDRDGKFMLDGIEPGPYRFSVGNNGYVRYDSARIDLTAGQLMNDIVVRMTQTAAVSGRITSTNGKLVAGLSVQLLRRTYNASGIPTFSTIATVQTNDLGEYRAYWITPGRYFVSANGRGGGVSIMDAGGEFDNAVQRNRNEVAETYPQTFFPGVADISQAYVVDLQEGVEVRGIDLSVPRQRELYAIRGRIIDSATGQPLARVTMSFGQIGLTGSTGFSTAARWYNPATGTFEVPNLAPGRYRIGVQVGDRISVTPAPAGVSSALVIATVASSDIENLTIILGPPTEIPGRIRIEGQLPATTSVDRLRVSLANSPPVNQTIYGSPSAVVTADGTFKLNAAPEGEFRVGITGLPAGFYLKEARLNEADVLNRPSRFSAAGNLDILISANGGQVSGRVLNEEMKPVPGVDAVLVPNESRNRPELFKRATTDKDGRFTIAGIAPGGYRVLAWERIEPYSYFDGSVLGKFEQHGTPVRVAESSRETVDVQLIPHETTR